ncbi:MAG: TetR/AcrR family transcriptional regulator [Microthrixaceae bacterium]
MRGIASVEAPREHVLEVAGRLFYAEGIRAVGVDRILAESGVAKATLYRHFRTKDDLVVAFIERRDELWRAWLAERVEALADDVFERPLVVFDAIAERVEAWGFRGCAFINTIAEFPDAAHPAHRAAVAHKARVRQYLESLLSDAGHDEPGDLAHQLMLLVDGAIAGAVRAQSPLPATVARRAAEVLLAEAQLPTTREGTGNVTAT